MRFPHNLSAILVFACLLAPQPAYAGTAYWTDAQFRWAFDEVARNLGAIEYASFTYMVEFGSPPDSLDDLRSTGHLNVLMTNPYTGGEVVSLTREDYPDGDLAGNVLVAEREQYEELHIEAWFIRPGDTANVRSMVKRISLYQSEVDREYFFGNELPRDEQMVTVYCRQAIDAIESFIQRNGRSPEHFDDMYANGDVNVHYINPISGELAVSSEELSEGDFLYRKMGEEGFTLIGWGREQPVFFATTEDSEETAFYDTYPELAEDPEDSEPTEDADENANEKDLGAPASPGLLKKSQCKAKSID